MEKLKAMAAPHLQDRTAEQIIRRWKVLKKDSDQMSVNTLSLAPHAGLTCFKNEFKANREKAGGLPQEVNTPVAPNSERPKLERTDKPERPEKPAKQQKIDSYTRVVENKQLPAAGATGAQSELTETLKSEVESLREQLKERDSQLDLRRQSFDKLRDEMEKMKNRFEERINIANELLCKALEAGERADRRARKEMMLRNSTLYGYIRTDAVGGQLVERLQGGEAYEELRIKKQQLEGER